MQTNTKVSCSPKLLKRSDFNDINEFVKHVEDYRQYQELKVTLENMKKALNDKVSRPTINDVTTNDNVICLREVRDSIQIETEDIGQVRESMQFDKEEIGQEQAQGEIVDQTFLDDNEDEFIFIQGSNWAKNRGELILGKRQRFT